MKKAMSARQDTEPKWKPPLQDLGQVSEGRICWPAVSAFCHMCCGDRIQRWGGGDHAASVRHQGHRFRRATQCIGREGRQEESAGSGAAGWSVDEDCTTDPQVHSCGRGWRFSQWLCCWRILGQIQNSQHLQWTGERLFVILVSYAVRLF